MDETTHKQTVKQTTTDALVELYCHVTELPDGPIKQRFLQRVRKQFLIIFFIHYFSLLAL